jgi:hypothetical protein
MELLEGGGTFRPSGPGRKKVIRDMPLMGMLGPQPLFLFPLLSSPLSQHNKMRGFIHLALHPKSNWTN